MLITPDFHDEYLYGIALTRKETLELSIRTRDNKCFKMEVPSIKELLVNNFREGNIIFGANAYVGAECQTKSEIIEKLYCIDKNTSFKLADAMRAIIDKNLFLFSLDSSYGCDIAAMSTAKPSDIKIQEI